jgi:plastocyanin
MVPGLTESRIYIKVRVGYVVAYRLEEVPVRLVERMIAYFSKTLLAFLLFGAVGGCAADGNIEGTIIVKKKLTKPRVTSSADEYARTPVELGTDPVQDPLAYERSHVVVYLEGENLPSRVVTATMEQKNRRFIPDLVVIPVGSTVSFPNLDEIFHNVFSLSKARSFDLGNYPMNHTKVKSFPTPGVVFVNCHLHPNMAAVIVVSPNGWSTKADDNGKFVLPQVPPGKYTIVAWHKSAGYFRQEITVTEKGKAGVEFLIPIDESAMAKGMSQK